MMYYVCIHTYIPIDSTSIIPLTLHTHFPWPRGNRAQRIRFEISPHRHSSIGIDDFGRDLRQGWPT